MSSLNIYGNILRLIFRNENCLVFVVYKSRKCKPPYGTNDFRTPSDSIIFKGTKNTWLRVSKIMIVIIHQSSRLLLLRVYHNIESTEFIKKKNDYYFCNLFALV